MATPSLLTLRSVLRSSRFGAAALVASLAAGALVMKDEPSLLATTQLPRSDYDRDGLSDLQELLLGTSPLVADTDSDGFSDLEERARGTDPLDVTLFPGGDDINLAITASQDDGRVTIMWTAFVSASKVGSVNLELGIVWKGQPMTLVPSGYRFSRGFLRHGKESGDRLASVEIDIPGLLMSRLGQLNFFGVLRDTDPASNSDPVVSTYTVRDFSGVTVAIGQLPLLTTTPGGPPPRMGVVFQPLAPQSQIPSSWSSGQICFQQTAAVGVNGLSIVHEIEAADCISMDTFCSPADCSSGVGGVLELPDPGALLGG
jgi:hypothetical protein